jgi:peptidyl-prolyl cis-trans isomerase SurA
MKKIQFVLIFVLTVLFAGAQKEKAILTIDDNPVSKSDFEYVFKKNNEDENITKQDLDEYMELFINYKLKVKEAEELGMDTAASFVKELNGYRNQLAAPYLIDKQVKEELIIEAYDRMKIELGASHILIKVDFDALPEDSLAAYQEALNIRNQILEGANFEKTARLLSSDPSVKTNSGDLGYFTVFQMVYPFETAAYNTAVGDISMPVRTRFGYHLIKVTDRRPARGEVRVAHILIMSNDKMKPEQRDNAKMKIYEIYGKLENGEDFEILARQFSDDKGSAQKGGELPMFGPGKMIAEFEEVSFDLNEVGEISEPFTTQYGWHIVMLLEHREIGTFEELEPTIEKKLKRDSRGKLSKSAFIEARKKEYDFKEYPENLKPFSDWVDSSIFNGNWKINPDWKTGKTLFSIAKTKYKQSDFLTYLHERMPRIKSKGIKNPSIQSFIDMQYKSFENSSVMNYEKSHLEEKYPEFKALMNEYHDGILLFELSDKKLWSRATTDTLGLMEFYEVHKNEYMWQERAEASVYKSIDKKTAKQVQDWVKTGIENDSILAMINIDSQLNLVIEEGVFSREDNAVLNNLVWTVGVSEISESNGQYVFTNITALRSPEPKSLNENKGVMISEYQKYLEAEWIAELRAKYFYVVNKEVLYSIAD